MGIFFARPKQNEGLGPRARTRSFGSSLPTWYSRLISQSTGISPEFYTRPALIYYLGQLSYFLRHSLLSPSSLGRRGRRHLFALPIERGEGERGAQSAQPAAAGRPNVHPTASASGDCSGTNPDRQTVDRRWDHSSQAPSFLLSLLPSLIWETRLSLLHALDRIPPPPTTSEDTNLSPLVRMGLGYMHGPKLHSQASVVRAAMSQ